MVDPETLRALRTDAEKSRMRRQQELKKSHVPFYASLLSLLSPGSRDLVERHADYAENDLVTDPNVLWRIIKETHATTTTGTGKEQILANKVLMQMDFNDLRQASNSGMHTVYTLSEDKYHKSKPAGGRGKAPGRGSGGRGRGRGGSAESLVTSKLASTEPTVTPLSEATRSIFGQYA